MEITSITIDTAINAKNSVEAWPPIRTGAGQSGRGFGKIKLVPTRRMDARSFFLPNAINSSQ
jgi:hypothetical protein